MKALCASRTVAHWRHSSMIFSPIIQWSLCPLRWTTRMVAGLEHLTYEEMLRQLHLLSVLLRWRRALRAAYNWWERLEKIGPDSLLEMHRDRRRGKRYKLQHGKIKLYIKKCFSTVSMGSYWNQDSDVVDAPSRDIQSSMRHNSEQPDVTGLALSWELDLAIILWFYKH